jgi:hypothetical protein
MAVCTDTDVSAFYDLHFPSNNAEPPKPARRLLPRWYTNTYVGGNLMWEQLRFAAYEWQSLLTFLGSLRMSYLDARGQVLSSGLWSGLGRSNFMHKFPSHFKTYVFETEGSGSEGITIYDRFFPDKRELLIFKSTER